MSRARVAVLLVAVSVSALFAVAGCSGTNGPPSPPPGPAVAIQDDRLANVYLADRPEDAEARLDLVEQTGARMMRVDLFWGSVAPTPPANPTDPADPAYNFGPFDKIVTGAARREITPIVAVYNAPPWATGGIVDSDIVTVYNSLAPEPGAYADFIEAVARRYSGRFDGPGGEPLPRIRFWEIWNEPNLNLYLSPQREGGENVSIEAYAGLVRAAYPRIKQGGGGDTVVLVGAAGPTSSTRKNRTSAIDWLRALRDADVPLDAYSQHIYPSAPPATETAVIPSWKTVDELLAELELWRPGLGLYVTEAGYTTAETPFRKRFVSDDEQAEYLRQIWSLPEVQDPRLKAIVWFNMQDNGNWPAGLLREDGSKKPSFDVFTELAARRQRPIDTKGT